MLLNLFLTLTIVAEIFGITGVQNKLLPSENSAKNPQVLGEKSLPQITLDDIASLPVNKNNSSINTRAKSAIILDTKTNKILYQKNIRESLPIASITKMMTAIVMFESFNLNEKITIDSHSAYVPGTKMHLLTGETISARQLVNSMLIASANDAARALESHFKKDKVIEKMNQKAKFLGLKNTQFADATGLDSNNKSSVEDLVIISRYAMRIPEFSRAVKMREYTAASSDGRIQHLIHTTNRLLNNYPDIRGVKTGYTEEAGNCLIAEAKRNQKDILSIVLGVDNYDIRFSESRELLDWGFDNFRW